MRTIVKEYRQVIANLEVNQKELKTKANKSCAQDGAAQSQLILTTTDLWINYAAYYIVKHNLYNKNAHEEYLNDQIKKCTVRFGREAWSKEYYKNEVMSIGNIRCDTSKFKRGFGIKPNPQSCVRQTRHLQHGTKL